MLSKMSDIFHSDISQLSVMDPVWELAGNRGATVFLQDRAGFPKHCTRHFARARCYEMGEAQGC